MASQHHTGAIKKQPNMRKSLWTPNEKKPVCGVAIPSHIESLEETKENEKLFTKPKLNSLLKLQDEIENIQSMKPPTLSSLADLTPRSKSVIFPKINQKLNVDARVAVFKNLVPINVNDALLLPKEPVSIRKKYLINQNKPPAPDLCDFLDPLPPLEHFIPEREVPFFIPEYEDDPLACFKRYMSEDIDE